MLIIEVIIYFAIVIALFIFVLVYSDVRKIRHYKISSTMLDQLFLIAVLAGFIAGMFVIVLTNPLNVLENQNDNHITALLTTSGTIIATILAVSFSISIFAIQHAVTSYSPSLLGYYIKDKATIVAFVLLSLSTALNLIGLDVPWRNIM